VEIAGAGKTTEKTIHMCFFAGSIVPSIYDVLIIKDNVIVYEFEELGTACGGVIWRFCKIFAILVVP